MRRSRLFRAIERAVDRRRIVARAKKYGRRRRKK